ncbi:MAG: M16 family metallopeptidase [Pirellulales bacterium]
MASLLALVLIATTAGSATLLPAAPASAAPKKLTSVEGITEYKLDNGLQVLLYPDPSRPTVTVNLTVLVGSRHEGYGETGMAHLLEHLVFKGTPTHQAIPRALQERGARFNGSTWVDRTNYYETLPASEDNLEFALRLEADRLVNSFISQNDLLSEMTVVRNEFEAGENDPANLLDNRIIATAFDWHNYGKSTIGNRTDIERVPINKLQDFYRKHYQPDNCVLVVAGRFDEPKALALIEKYFGALPKPKRTVDRTYTEEPPQDGERSVTLRRVGEVGIVGLCYHAPAGAHPDNAVMDVLANCLASAPAGRLYKALVETKLATNVGAGNASWHDPGVFQVQAEVRKGDSIDVVRDKLIEITEAAGDKPFSDEDVERAKQQLIKQRELVAADTSRIAVQLSEWAAQGDWRLYFLHRDRIESVTPQQVQEAAKRYLRRENRTVGVFIPTAEPHKTEVPATPDLVKLFEGYKGRGEIAQGEVFDVSPQNIESRVERTTLPEGVKAALLPKKTRGETVNLRLTLRYGNLESLKGYVTAAELLPQLMLRGTKKLTRQQIDDELDKQRARLSAFGDTGSITFSVQTKRANLPAVLNLLKQILREPTLPADEFEVLRREQLAAAEEQKTDPAALAITKLRRTVSPYAKDDVRYIPTVEEEIERYQGVTRDQLQQLYDKFLGSQVGELAIVGDFDGPQTLNLLREALSGWTTSQSYARIPRELFPQVAGGLERIDTPDKANAVYAAGLAFAMKDTDPKYPAMVIGNYVLGAGTLSSRLGDRVRQKEGLSYGVRSYMAAESLDDRASLTINAICNPANIDKVNVAVAEELAKLLADGITQEELTRAQQGYLQQQQVARTDDGALAGVLADLLFTDRTMQYYAQLESQIAALKPAEVGEALRKNIDPKKLVVVDAGDFSAKAAAEAKAEPAK